MQMKRKQIQKTKRNRKTSQSNATKSLPNVHHGPMLIHVYDQIHRLASRIGANSVLGLQKYMHAGLKALCSGQSLSNNPKRRTVDLSKRVFGVQKRPSAPFNLIISTPNHWNHR